MSSAGPSSPTTVDSNSHFGFSDQSSVNIHVTEENQDLGLLQEIPGHGTQEFPLEGKQELFEPNQSPQQSPVETSEPGGQDTAEEVSQTSQEVPDISQPCCDIFEEISQPNQEVPDISQSLLQNHDTITSTYHPCQTGQLSQKVCEEVFQLCQENSEEINQLYQEVPVEPGRLTHEFSLRVEGMAQETLMEVGRPTQKISKEISQPCQEFSVEVGSLAEETSVISVLSQDIPEADNPSQELTGEIDLQVQEVSVEINQESWVVPDVADEMPSEDIPQVQYLSSDLNPQSESLAHDQHSPLPPATCN